MVRVSFCAYCCLILIILFPPLNSDGLVHFLTSKSIHMSLAKTKPRPTDELKMDDEGFVTPSKAISLPGLSLSIWVVTLILYQLLVAMESCLN